VSAPRECSRCHGSKLVLGTVVDDGPARKVTIVCESCGKIDRVETQESIETVRNWYCEN